MIFSTSKKFIFIHVPKTAGWSIMDALTPFARDRKRSMFRSFSRRLPIRENVEAAHFRVHDTARTVIDKLGRDVFDQFHSFAFVRNPFEHAVSHYEYMKQYRIKPTAKKVGAMSFEEYLRYRKLKPFWNDTLFARLPDQTHFIDDDEGRIAIKEVLQFENLAEDFKSVVEKLELENVTLPYVNKTKTKSDKKPTNAYYSPACIDLVLEIYDRDFENFGYSRQFSE